MKRAPTASASQRRGRGMIGGQAFRQVAMTEETTAVPFRLRARRSLLITRLCGVGGLGVLLLYGAHALAVPGAPVAQQRARPASAPIALDAATTILIGADEPPALLEAARDLASDFEKVVGQKPRLVQRP